MCARVKGRAFPVLRHGVPPQRRQPCSSSAAAHTYVNEPRCGLPARSAATHLGNTRTHEQLLNIRRRTDLVNRNAPNQSARGGPSHERPRTGALCKQPSTAAVRLAPEKSERAAQTKAASPNTVVTYFRQGQRPFDRAKERALIFGRGDVRGPGEGVARRRLPLVASVRIGIIDGRELGARLVEGAISRPHLVGCSVDRCECRPSEYCELPCAHRRNQQYGNRHGRRVCSQLRRNQGASGADAHWKTSTEFAPF
jgi:hypothetical protein